MTATVDANILVYASDTSSKFYEDSLDFLRGVTRNHQIFYVFWPTIMAYLRIITHPRIMKSPLSLEDAIKNVDSLTQWPQIQVCGEPEQFLSQLRYVAKNVYVRGNLVPDAHIVGLMHHYGVSTIWTNDSDFKKFDGITVQSPFYMRNKTNG